MFDYFIGKNTSGLDYEQSIKRYTQQQKDIEPFFIEHVLHHNTYFRTLSAIESLSSEYKEVASYALLHKKNIPQFKQHCYTAGYLLLIGTDPAYLFLSFPLIMSDNEKLKNYIINQIDNLPHDEYNPKQQSQTFINNNTILALAGKFDELKERSKIFLKAHNKYNERRVPEHLFYLALIDKDVKKMKESLELLLEPRMARKSVYGIDNAFSFYLQTQLLLHAKIAAHHGYDLGIDHPSAPKELIKIEPLKEYKIEYDFMKEFDFNYPQQVWIDKIQYTDKIVDYWRTKVEELEKKKRSFLGIKF